MKCEWIAYGTSAPEDVYKRNLETCYVMTVFLVDLTVIKTGPK